MKLARIILPVMAAVSLVAVVAIVSCSKSGGDSTPTNPGGGATLELNSGNIPAGGVYQHAFATAGAYPYHCAIHGTAMAGQVTVAAASAVDSVLVTIGPGLTYTPASATVKPGGTVRWINAGSTHTVTSD